ncbi:MAG TPA: hypothetical protein DCW74_09510 [Alteromonas australica]|uniref:DUF2244 domain-containing protein n=2 Tax=Pseudomonadati TaxID=3379134 RepID=A0A075P078_9ALTE|nr:MULTISPECIES: hypothetical protein [Alteromonas]MAF70550.1 hypothetical protein [Alteromonas sp.]AIF99266.1 hypothetical protein EP13_11550 [Alteromonas australica]AJP44320.1 hypothetical protein EP12_12230 [Alteromonas australica]MBU33880.1 hypothetical protein [Alteromonas sp.]QPL51453.1 hypothetical protein IUA53_07620 [Alteromonas sp. B31-7]
MSSQSSVVLRQYDKQTLKHVDIISGISPNAMRRVFGGWILFVAIVAVIVSVAPDLSVQFIGLTLFVLVAFTLLMFGQSRISEGWPAIICDDNTVGVVRDPVKREYICVDKSLVTVANPTLIKPNKKAIEIVLDASRLTESDVAVLNQAVWPRSDRLLGLSHFKRREDACDSVMWCVKHLRKRPVEHVSTQTA